MPVFIESYYETPLGWRSAGAAEVNAADLLDFFSTPSEDLYVSAAQLCEEMVEIKRSHRVSFIPKERNECLFNTPVEAEMFFKLLRPLVGQGVIP